MVIHFSRAANKSAEVTCAPWGNAVNSALLQGRVLKFVQLVFFFLILSCSESERIVPEHKVLARVDGEVLSSDDVSAMLSGSSDELDVQDIQRQYTKRWIEGELLAQEAKKLGYGLTDEQRFQIENITRDYLAKAYLETRLRDVDVTASDVRRYYEDHEEEFKRLDDEYHLIHLFVPQRLRAVQTEIYASKDILAVIKKFHLSKTVNDQLLNGDLGIVRGKQLSEKLKARIDKATIDRIYGPIRIAGGYHYFQVKSREAKGTFYPLERVRDSIRERMYLQKIEETKHAIVEELKENYSIESKF